MSSTETDIVVFVFWEFITHMDVYELSTSLVLPLDFVTVMVWTTSPSSCPMATRATTLCTPQQPRA